MAQTGETLKNISVFNEDLLREVDDAKVKRPLWIRLCLFFKAPFSVIIDFPWGAVLVTLKRFRGQDYVDSVQILELYQPVPIFDNNSDTTH